MKKQELIEGVHYYLDEQENFVFTSLYHREKGYCCGFGCKHCPYEYENVPEPKKSHLLASRKTPDNP